MNNADKLTRPILKASKEQGNVISHEYEGGLTKREAFAMAAMQGILANKFSRTSVAKALDENGFMSEMKDVATIISEEAVIYADALLKELEETQ